MSQEKQENKAHEKHNGLNSKNDKQTNNDGFLGIKFYDQEEEKVNNSLFGVPTWNNSQDNSNQNFLNPSITPALQDLIHKLEVAIQSNNFDSATIEIYRQASQLANIDTIIKQSNIINQSTIALFRDKERELSDQQKLVNPQQTQQNYKTDDDFQQQHFPNQVQDLRTLQAGFLSERENYKESLANKENEIKQQGGIDKDSFNQH